MTPLTARRGLTIRSAAIPELNGAGWLEPLKLEGEEGINTLFEYRLVLQGPDGGGGGALELDRFIGRELTCCIELEGHGRFLPGVPGGSPAQRGAGVREISGLITQTRHLGQAGQRALVELTLRPWLHLATLTTDCKVFQDQSVVDIIETVLGEYPFAADKRLIERYPQRDYTVQYNESDYEFLSRITATLVKGDVRMPLPVGKTQHFELEPFTHWPGNKTEAITPEARHLFLYGPPA